MLLIMVRTVPSRAAAGRRPRPSQPELPEDDRPELPALDIEDDAERGGSADGLGLEQDEALELELPKSGAKALGDETPAEVPIDLSFVVDDGGPSAVGDERTGLGDAPDAADLPIDECSGSFVEPDGTEQGLGDSDELGIEPIAEAGEDSDANGLDDPLGERIASEELPTLDRDGGADDEPLDVGVAIEPPDG